MCIIQKYDKLQGESKLINAKFLLKVITKMYKQTFMRKDVQFINRIKKKQTIKQI